MVKVGTLGSVRAILGGRASWNISGSRPSSHHSSLASSIFYIIHNTVLNRESQTAKSTVAMGNSFRAHFRFCIRKGVLALNPFKTLFYIIHLVITHKKSTGESEIPCLVGLIGCVCKTRCRSTQSNPEIYISHVLYQIPFLT